jgi:hypothetical protein
MLRALSQEPDDVEWSAADHDRDVVQNASLQQESSNSKRKRESGFFCAPQMFGGGIYLPDPSTYDPIEILLNTDDRTERHELVKIWRDNKLSELNFVGVVVCTFTHLARIS